LFGLPKPWYFPLTKTYWCGGQHVETDLHCELTDCLSAFRCRQTELSVMEEDQACCMEQSPHGLSLDLTNNKLVN